MCLTVLLLTAGCVAKDNRPVPVAALPIAKPTPARSSEEPDEPRPPSPNFPAASPFLPAVVRAGLFPMRDYVVLESIDFRGQIEVEGKRYFVLHLNMYLWLSSYNQRGASGWLICDEDMNPAWKNPDWGGTPGKCFGNHVRVHLTDKFFEIHENYEYGDLITFRREGDKLVASIGWESDKTRIAQFLNYPKWRDDSHEPDEEVTKILPVAGHPTWRIVLTRYPGGNQGCAHLIDETGHGEFGCVSLPGIWTDQACRPVDAGSSIQEDGSGTLVWVDYVTHGGYRHTYRAVLSDGKCIPLSDTSEG